MVELVGFREGEDTDNGTFVGGGCKEGAGVVDRYAGERGAVGHDNVDSLELGGVEQQDVACGRGDMGAARRSV